MEIRELLLRRSGLVALPAGSGEAEPRLVQGVELELAGLGYVVSPRLRARLASLDPLALTGAKTWVCGALAAKLGADRRHTPLFRRFPEGVPQDTTTLWVQKVIGHYLQEPEQPCLFCGAVATTHVLRPCLHVVCDRCFDGSNYSRCPTCERVVDTTSPFFKPDEVDRSLRDDVKIRFTWLDLCEDLEAAARQLYQSLCARAQVMSPDDVAALQSLVAAFGLGVLPWTPDKIPVRENRAHIFGALLRGQPPEVVLEAARPHLRTATDVMRLVAAYSGADPALQKTARKAIFSSERERRWSAPTRGFVARILDHFKKRGATPAVPVNVNSARFKIAKLSRPLRRALLGLLESMPPEALAEDMARHAALWVRLGEVLHPFEQAARFPNAARAFANVRGSTGAFAEGLLSGADAQRWERDRRGRLRFVSYNARTERLLAQGDTAALGQHLAARPGELARRLDLLLRREVALGRRGAESNLLARLDRVSTPVLLGLCASLPRRDRALPVRLWFPKGVEFRAFSAEDKRVALPPDRTAPVVEAVERELLRRFAARPRFDEALLDAALGAVIVPFNERTASRSAVALPRGSSLAVPPGPIARLFLHWCQPANGYDTDYDLSVGLYRADWSYLDVCSYYQLEARHEGRRVAASSGDCRDGPWPDGGTEFVDLHRAEALASGARYAVMVVNAYSGMPFSAMERCFAGIMLREDLSGAVFDPRTVALRFDLQGKCGVYLPLVFDLVESRLHWLDVYSPGQIELNNVASSNAAIQRIGPAVLAYFASGTRPNLLQLGALHAAARCGRVTVIHGGGAFLYERRDGEDEHAFYRRILSGSPDGMQTELPAPAGPVFAALAEGYFPLPEGSEVYALDRAAVVNPIAAADLLS